MTQSDPRQSRLLTWINSLPGLGCEKLEMVSGDASFRRYFRFHANGNSYIAVDAPVEHEDNPRFIAVAEAYREHDVPVPAPVAFDFDNGFMCLEDFGDILFSDRVTVDNCETLYLKALDLLPPIQACVKTSQGNIPAFDSELLQSEFHLFSHWLCEVHLKLGLSEQQQQVMQSSFSVLAAAFEAQPQVGVHRDYHSRNLMLLDDDSIGVIDFQDAVVGPLTYDAVSLLRDCYQDWDDALITGILRTHHEQHYSQYAWQDFKRWFDLTGIQRHVKASGIFARLCHRDGKATYLNDIPHTLDYIINVGKAYPEFDEFVTLVSDVIKPAMEASL